MYIYIYIYIYIYCLDIRRPLLCRGIHTLTNAWQGNPAARVGKCPPIVDHLLLIVAVLAVVLLTADQQVSGCDW